MSGEDDTQPQLTPTLASRVAELERVIGGLPIGSRPLIARLLGQWRARDYADGREGRALSQTMAAVRPPKG